MYVSNKNRLKKLNTGFQIYIRDLRLSDLLINPCIELNFNKPKLLCCVTMQFICCYNFSGHGTFKCNEKFNITRE